MSKLENDAITCVGNIISKVRSQDAIFGLSVSKEGRETAWIWLQVDLLCSKRYLNSLQNVGWIYSLF